MMAQLVDAQPYRDGEARSDHRDGDDCGGDRPDVGTGLAAARAAAAGRGPRPATLRPTADQDWAGEPPYDPEYDGPPRSTIGYEGFDPGDEPTDEVIDERTARQTSEQQAMQLLQQTLGAERIGEIDAK